MQHSWKPNPTNPRTEVCARPGCTAERREAYGTVHDYRRNADAVWNRDIMPRCTGKSMRKPRRKPTDKGDEI